MRMTKNRKKILNLFKDSKKPLTAEDIFIILNKEIDLSTIYRTLNYFYNNHLLLTFYLNNKNFYYLNTKEHHHYFICTNCLNMFKIKCMIHDVIKDIEKDNNFIIQNHEMNFYGLCNVCK